MRHELQMSMAVFLGAGIGGVLRHLVNRLAMVALPASFPFATFIVNVTGCFLMGAIAGWFAWRGAGGGQALRLFLATGILGGFTTFSAFSLDAALLWERGQMGSAVLYVLGSVILSLAGVAAGLAASRTVLS